MCAIFILYIIINLWLGIDRESGLCVSLWLTQSWSESRHVSERMSIGTHNPGACQTERPQGISWHGILQSYFIVLCTYKWYVLLELLERERPIQIPNIKQNAASNQNTIKKQCFEVDFNGRLKRYQIQSATSWLEAKHNRTVRSGNA